MCFTDKVKEERVSGVYNETHTGEDTPVVSFNTKQVILFFLTSMFPQAYTVFYLLVACMNVATHLLHLLG